MEREKLINAAQMKELPELVLKNGRIVNVFTGEIIKGDVAVTDGVIVGTGEYSGKKEIDLEGRFVLPGFVNSHLHVESSMVTPDNYSLEELRQGTTTIITDPHEFANVKGVIALRDVLAAARRSVVNYYVMLPSCVPATPFEHSGARLEAEDLLPFKDDPNVLGLAEMMNVPGVTGCDKDVMDKLSAFDDMVIDGHFPGGQGKALNAYVCAGVKTDHESVTFEEALEKIRAGMAVLVREGSASKNLEAIISGVVSSGIYTDRLAFCTDDKHLADIRREGTIRYCIRRSIGLGLPAVRAVQMATINAARIYGLKDIGAVACGYRADIVVADSLEEMNIWKVFKDGIPADEISLTEKELYNAKLLDDVHCAPLDENAFEIPERESYNVIGLMENQIITKALKMTREEVEKGLRKGTVRKIAVVERHNASGEHSAAYVSGYGLTHGAVATTVAHDSHNIVVIGDNDRDMLRAVEVLKETGGGYVIVRDNKTEGVLPLKLCGLVSLSSPEEFIPALENIIQKAYEMGVNKEIDPFITLSFCALPVIPELRITDCGLFDVRKFSFTD